MELSLPPFLLDHVGGLAVWQWFGSLVVVSLGLALGRLAASGIRRLLEKVVRRTPMPWDDEIARAIHTPAQLWCTIVLIYLGLKSLKLPKADLADLATFTRAGAIAAVVWGMIRALFAIAERVADETLMRDTADPQRLARARSLRTQIIVATRVVSVLLFMFGAALVALQFSVVRSVGMSLLASAGVAGVVLGFAAQKSLGALLAGIQISLSQPIRIGDSVFLQGEFGTIEDIGLTYVVVRLWDDRRLFVPTPRFLEEPFQNWSRTHVGLLGTIFFKVDYHVPIPALRGEFERIIEKEPLWDKRVKSMQVTDAGEKCLELRFLVSARTPSALWDLRVAVREKLAIWLQGLDEGAHLPRTRLVMEQLPADGQRRESGPYTSSTTR